MTTLLPSAQPVAMVRRVLGRVGRYVFLVLVGTFFALPMLWLVFAPFDRTPSLAARPPDFTLENFIRVFDNPFVVSSLRNSVVLSLAAMFAASAVAIFQHDVKRMFAYSSVAQIGYITLGIGVDNQSSLTGSIVHLLNHGVTKGAIFLLLGGVLLRAGSAALTLESLAGLGRRMPLTALGLTIAGLSLVGIPGTAGFVTKWYLVLGALERGWWWLVAAIVASSLIAVAYVWRVVESAYLRPSASPAAAGEAPPAMLAAGGAMVVLSVYFGFETGFSVGGAAEAAALLLRGLR